MLGLRQIASALGSATIFKVAALWTLPKSANDRAVVGSETPSLVTVRSFSTEKVRTASQRLSAVLMPMQTKRASKEAHSDSRLHFASLEIGIGLT